MDLLSGLAHCIWELLSYCCVISAVVFSSSFQIRYPNFQITLFFRQLFSFLILAFESPETIGTSFFGSSWNVFKWPKFCTPQTGTRLLYHNLCSCIMHSGARFFWYQKLDPNRILFCSAPETWNHVIQLHFCHWLMCFVYILYMVCDKHNYR